MHQYDTFHILFPVAPPLDPPVTLPVVEYKIVAKKLQKWELLLAGIFIRLLVRECISTAHLINPISTTIVLKEWRREY